MPRSIGEARETIDRGATGAGVSPRVGTGMISAVGGISSARASSLIGRGVTTAPAPPSVAPPPVNQQAISAYLRQALSIPSMANNVVSPSTPGVIIGQNDPFDTLSDVFRSVFGSDAFNPQTSSGQALVPVQSGGGSSSIMLFLILGVVGFAIYYFFIRKKGGEAS